MSQSGRVRESDARRILVVYEESRLLARIARSVGADGVIAATREPRRAAKLLAVPGNRIGLLIVICTAAGGRRYASRTGLIKTVFRQWPWIPVVMISRAQERIRLMGDVMLSGVRAFMRSTASEADLREAIGRTRPRNGLRVPSAASTVAMKRIGVYLGAHVGESFALDELAQMASMSRSHFSHTFHSVFGMSLRAYVRSLRLEHTHRLLLKTPNSITAIAAEAGFFDLPHFDKAFRQRLGVTPQEFRRRYNGSPRRRPE